jgi:hypothetical protein
MKKKEERPMTRSEEKNLEDAIVRGIRNGTITNRHDSSTLKDSFRADHKSIEKFISQKSATPQSLLREGDGTGTRALRQLSNSCRLIPGMVKAISESKNVELDSTSIKSIKNAVKYLTTLSI